MHPDIHFVKQNFPHQNFYLTRNKKACIIQSYPVSVKGAGGFIRINSDAKSELRPKRRRKTNIWI